jgi:hypothetical protein
MPTIGFVWLWCPTWIPWGQMIELHLTALEWAFTSRKRELGEEWEIHSWPFLLPVHYSKAPLLSTGCLVNWTHATWLLSSPGWWWSGGQHMPACVIAVPPSWLTSCFPHTAVQAPPTKCNHSILAPGGVPENPGLDYIKQILSRVTGEQLHSQYCVKNGIERIFYMQAVISSFTSFKQKDKHVYQFTLLVKTLLK